MKGRVSVYLLSACEVFSFSGGWDWAGSHFQWGSNLPSLHLLDQQVKSFLSNAMHWIGLDKKNGSPKNTFLNTQASLGYLFGRGAGSGNSEAFPGRPRRWRQVGLETLFNLVLEIYIY